MPENGDYLRSFSLLINKTLNHRVDDPEGLFKEDEEGTNSILKIWKDDCFEKGAPVLCRQVRNFRYFFLNSCKARVALVAFC